jgi:hypothetical protein
MKWYNYAIPPIDINWGQLKSPTEVIREMTHDFNEVDELRRFIKDLSSAMEAFNSMGWQSTVTSDGVFYVPLENEFHYGFALKESDNGTTYIASPIPFPHLEEYLDGS